jgi:hypothetical protein
MAHLLNANTAFGLAEQKKEKDNEAFLLLCQYVDRKIRTAACMGQRDTILTMPPLIQTTAELNVPYVQPLSDHLQVSGFFVQILTSNTIYISWRYPPTKRVGV